MPALPDSQKDDAALVKQAKSGNTQAFGVLYERYVMDIYRFIRAQTADHLEAEDLTANVFLKAWDVLGRYQERGFPFSAFLYKIARNTLIDHWRKQQKALKGSEVPLEQLEDSLTSNQGNPQQQPDPRVLWQVMHRLPEDYRSVLVYRFMNGLSPREIAAVMSKSEGAVRVLQYRALRAARRLLVEMGEKNAKI